MKLRSLFVFVIVFGLALSVNAREKPFAGVNWNIFIERDKGIKELIEADRMLDPILTKIKLLYEQIVSSRNELEKEIKKPCESLDSCVHKKDLLKAKISVHNQLVEQYLAYGQDYERQIQKYFNPVKEKVAGVLKEYGKRNGFAEVIDLSAEHDSDNNRKIIIDITETFIEYYNSSINEN